MFVCIRASTILDIDNISAPVNMDGIFLNVI